MEQLIPLIEPLIWVGINTYVRRVTNENASLSNTLNDVTCDVINMSSVVAFLNAMALMYLNSCKHQYLLSHRERAALQSVVSANDRSGLSFGSSAAGVTLFLFVIQNGFETSDIGFFYAFVTAHAGLSYALTTFILTLLMISGPGHNIFFTEMMPVTYIISIALSIFRAEQFDMDSNHVSIISVVSIIQIVLWLLFMGLLGFDKTDDKTDRFAKKRLSVSQQLQNVFSFGEWVVVSAFLSLILADYFLRVVVSNQFFNSAHLEIDVLVSEAGICGCLFGIYISTTFNLSEICRRVLKFIQLEKRLGFLAWMISAISIVLITISFINVALIRYCDQITNENSFCPEDIIWSNFVPIGSAFFALSIRWLSSYVSQPECHLFLKSDWSAARLTVLLYWVFIMAACLPIAFSIGEHLKSTNASNSSRKRAVVVARKYFHFVAVLLFFGPTLHAPRILSLSYAVATGLLMLMEHIRCEHTDVISPRTYRDIVAYGSNPSSKSIISNFFELFFDEKDKGAKEGGFVVSHISLIVGCALPMWMYMVNPVCNIAPFLGIISVGIGDAVGAIVGSYFGKHKWPGSNRTLEGSIAMLFSMSTVTYALLLTFNLEIDYFGTFLSLVLLSLMEAFTYQIDNLYLPLLSIALMYSLGCDSSA